MLSSKLKHDAGALHGQVGLKQHEQGLQKGTEYTALRASGLRVSAEAVRLPILTTGGLPVRRSRIPLQGEVLKTLMQS